MKFTQKILLILLLAASSAAVGQNRFRYISLKEDVRSEDSTSASLRVQNFFNYKDTSYIRTLREITGNQKRLFFEIRDDGRFNAATYLGLRAVNRGADSASALLGVSPRGMGFLSGRRVNLSTGAVTGAFNPFWQQWNDSANWYINGTKVLWLDYLGVLSGKFSTQTGSSIGGEFLVDGTVIADKLTSNSQSFTSSIAFSDSTDVIVKWTAGQVKLANGAIFDIPAGNTGTMTGLTYIYINIGGSTGAYFNALDIGNTGLMQIGNQSGFTSEGGTQRSFTNGIAYVRMDGATYAPNSGDKVAVKDNNPANEFTFLTDFATNAELTALIDAVSGIRASSDNVLITITGDEALSISTAFGDIAAENILLLCVAKPAATSNQQAFFVSAVGVLGVNETNISANSISADKIQANAVIASKINVVDLAAIKTTTGTLNILTGGYLRSGQTAYDAGTGFYLGNDGGTPKFSIGNSAGNKFTWDGTDLNVVGKFRTSTGSQRLDMTGDSLVFYVGSNPVAWFGSSVVGGNPGLRLLNGTIRIDSLELNRDVQWYFKHANAGPLWRVYQGGATALPRLMLRSGTVESGKLDLYLDGLIHIGEDPDELSGFTAGLLIKKGSLYVADNATIQDTLFMPTGGSVGDFLTKSTSSGKAVWTTFSPAQATDSSQRTLYTLQVDSVLQKTNTTAGFTAYVTFSYTRLPTDSIIAAEFNMTAAVSEGGFVGAQLKVATPSAITANLFQTTSVTDTARTLRASLETMGVDSTYNVTFELYVESPQDTISITDLRIYIIESFIATESQTVNPERSFEYFEDFLGNPGITTGTITYKDWRIGSNLSGSGGDTSFVGNAMGVASAFGTSGARLAMVPYTTLNNRGTFRLNQGSLSLQIRLKRITNSALNDSLRWGFISTDLSGSAASFAITRPNSGAYFEHFENSGDSVYAYLKNGATVDSANTGVVATHNTWRTYRINLSDTTATFTIDGVVVATLYGTISNDLHDIMVWDKTPAVSFGFYVDYIWARQRLDRRW